MDAKFEQFKAMFLQECREHIVSLEHTLAAIAGNPADAELIDTAFRAIHSIKGGAGMFGFDRIVPFAHRFEAVLDGVRLREIAASPGLIAAALRATDRLADLVLAASTGTELPEDYESAQIESLEAASGPPALNPAAPDLSRQFRIGFRPHAHLLQSAVEPLFIFGKLQELGRLSVRADLDNLPALDGMRATEAYLHWTLELETACGEAAVREAFQFARGDCDLEITALAPEAAAAAAPPAPTIRVETARIDRLVDLAGEIAIAQTLVAQLIDQPLLALNPQLFQELQQLLSYTQTLQDSVMAIRAQPAAAIFERMPRFVRELCEQTGKQIYLRLEGAGTEIDKTVVELLADPIMHMISNAASHGLESAAERKAAGKPEAGVIALSARQTGNRIIIEVSDDGRGIDRARLRAKAVGRGLIAGDAVLSPEEIDRLIFLPGISTAEAVTNLSGRGVGMDVVKRNIQKLGGSASIRSEPGRGSAVTLTLPLTLAVMNGMIVRAGCDTYVIPLASICECRAAWQSGARLVPGSGHMMAHDGKLISLIELGAMFHAGTPRSPQAIAVIAMIEDGDPVALLADEILGQQQVVTKPVPAHLEPMPGMAGATILGDGRVAFILDIAEIAALTRDNADRIRRVAA